MTIRNDESIEKTISIEQFHTREEVRRFLLELFIGEDCKTKLRYYVEIVEENRIYIERPGRLNKGCDFVIYVENLITWNNGNDKPPKHDDLFEDLEKKQNELTKEEFECLKSAIKDIYELKSYSEAIAHTINLPVSIGWSYELILKLIRWFFVEQDITYWARSGREMLFEGINDL
jgi:hypothetical protein